MVASYFNYLNKGDFKSAYDNLTTAMKKKQSYADFEKSQFTTIVYDVKRLCTNQKSATNTSVDATVETRGKSGGNKKTAVYKFTVTKEGTQWKINSFSQ
ncbi:MAG: hypothetical protein AB2L14_13415 [Candidatus Xenobiia bacterium LiM19]